jgi:hypothetical protein
MELKEDGMKRKEKNADTVNTTGMDWKRMFCVLFSGDQVVGRQKLAHHQEYCSDICGGCVQCLASPA